MQLNFEFSGEKTPRREISVNAFESIIELLDSTVGYFKCTNYPTAKSLKDFKNGILFLLEDLIDGENLIEVENYLKEIVSSKAPFIEEYFEDPTPEYSSIQLKYLKKCKASKKQQGAFYTPQDVIINVLKSSKEIWGINENEVIKMRVLDPTMGAADWLLNWFNLCVKSNKTNTTSSKMSLFKKCIYGVDLDPVAVLTSRLIFWHQFEYENTIVHSIGKNLILGDALDPIRGRALFKGKKFDAIIGNPPYVVQNLKGLNCYTNKTNNLYSVITESATEMLRPGGHISFVIPLSFVCSKKISDLREYCINEYSEINYSNYAIRPMKMFEGVDQRISIFIGTKKEGVHEKCKVYSTGGYFRWRDRNDLNELLLNLSNRVEVELEKRSFNGLWPKIENSIEEKILEKIKKLSAKQGNLLNLTSKTKTRYPIYYYGNGRYFIKALNYKPYYKNNIKPDKENSELKVIYAENSEAQKTIISIMNSKIYFWLWTVYSDCFHVDYKLLELIPHSLKFQRLIKGCDILMKSMKKSSVKKKHGDNVITEFKIRESLEIVKELDENVFDALTLNLNEKKFLRCFAQDVRGAVKKGAAA
jgi:type I restriction-modification system DNA methylase subunit